MKIKESGFELENLEGKKLRNTKKDKIVLVSGSFDLLHSGHVNFLERCKSCGDILVVAVNSDKIVKSRKGKSRPINTESHRAHLVASLKSVDHVFIKREMFKKGALKVVSPDVIIFGKEKSKDFKNYQKIIDNYKISHPNIKCVVLDRQNSYTNKGNSTTKIINKILKKYKNTKK